MLRNQLKNLSFYFDNTPFAFCIMHILEDSINKDVEIFYANNEFYNLQSKYFINITDNYVSNISTYKKIAYEGGITTIRINNDKLKKYFLVKVYQISEGYCGCVFSDITERNEKKQIEKQLLHEKLSTELILKKTKTYVFEYEIQSETCHFSKNVIDDFGICEFLEDIPNSLFNLDILDEDSYYEIIKTYKEVRNGNKDASTVIMINHIDGKKSWLKLQYENIEYKNNIPYKALGYLVDVTNYIYNEMLKKQEINYQESIQGERLIGKAQINISKNIMESYATNNSISKFFTGMAYSDALKYLYDAINEKDLKSLKENMDINAILKKYENNEYNYSVKYQRKIKNGEMAWVETYIKIYKNFLNSDVMCFMYTYDCSNEERMQLIIKNIIEADCELVATINIQTQMITAYTSTKGQISILYVNKHYDDGYIPSITKVICKEYLDEAIENMSITKLLENLENNKYIEYVYKCYPTNGEDTYRRWRFSYLDEDKSNIVLIRSEISKIFKDKEKQRTTIQKALIEAEKANNAKTDFLSRISHDMRTPMNGILGLLDKTSDMEMSSELRDIINKIKGSSNFLLGLINDTLDMNQIERNNLKLNIDAYESDVVLLEALEMAKAYAANKNISISVTQKNIQNSVVRLDKLRVQQILLNIISNAVKFSKPGEVVDIFVECYKRENNIIYDKFVVKDHGVGMSKEFIPKIFEPFSQENNNVYTKQSGAGLGMSIVKRLVELMGGNVEVTSKKNEGTTITVYLNFEKVEEYNYVEESKSIINNLKNKRILICEDNPLNREVVVYMLEKAGCLVDAVENGKIGLDKIKNSCENHYDAILMDIQMPVMDGYQATKEIRNLDRKDVKKLPIIAVTANAFENDIKKTFASGMNEHISKPIEITTLYNTLTKYFK